MTVCIALTKGRLEKQFLDFFHSLSFDIEPLVNKGRKLTVQSGPFEFIFAKGVDVATYVEYGIADLGIIGEDILLENQPDVFDLLPLPFGYCRFALAAEKDQNLTEKKRRIASKYPNITTAYFRKKGESVDVVKLEGSVELAPILGLADAIVDLVETGTTLKENGLVIYEELHQISARCIANRSALKIKRNELMPLIEVFQTREALK